MRLLPTHGRQVHSEARRGIEGAVVVAVPPARRIPWNTVANAGMLGDRMPTTSPTPIPRDANAPAAASICEINCP